MTVRDVTIHVSRDDRIPEWPYSATKTGRGYTSLTSPLGSQRLRHWLIDRAVLR